jgi:hypothetical protein
MIYLVFSVFTCRPTSLPASNRASVSFFDIYVFTGYINIVSTDQELTYSIQFHSLILLDLPDGIFQSEVQKQ